MKTPFVLSEHTMWSWFKLIFITASGFHFSDLASTNMVENTLAPLVFVIGVIWMLVKIFARSLSSRSDGGSFSTSAGGNSASDAGSGDCGGGD